MPVFDNGQQASEVSLYGKVTNPGDTPVNVNEQGKLEVEIGVGGNEITETDVGSHKSIDVNVLPFAGVVGGGRQTATTTASALNGGTSMPCSRVILTSDDGATNNKNANVVWIGGSGVTANAGYPIRPSYSNAEHLVFDVQDVNKIFIYTASGTDKISWVALG